MAEYKEQFLHGLSGPLGLLTDIFEKLQPGGMPELEAAIAPEQFELLRDAIQIGQDEKAANRSDAGGSILAEMFQAMGADAISLFMPQTPQEIVSDKALDLLLPGGGAALSTLVSPQIVKKLSKGIRGDLPTWLRHTAKQNADVADAVDWLPDDQPEALIRQALDVASGRARRFESSAGGLATRDVGIEDLPNIMYHVTTSKPGVKTDKTLFGLTGGEGGSVTGAGGAMFPGVSLTDDLIGALRLKQEMSRLGQMQRGAKKTTTFADSIAKFAKEDADRYGEDVVKEAQEFATKHFEFLIEQEKEIAKGKPLPLSTVKQHMSNAFNKYLTTRGDNPVILSGDVSNAVFDIVGVTPQDIARSFKGRELPNISSGVDAVGNEFRIAGDINLSDETQEAVKEILREIAPEFHARPAGKRVPAHTDPDWDRLGLGEHHISPEDVDEARAFMEELGVEFPESFAVMGDQTPELPAAIKALEDRLRNLGLGEDEIELEIASALSYAGY